MNTHDSSPEMVYIMIGEGEDTRHCTYFFESEYGGRLVYCNSTSFWQADGKRLVDFFGGEMDSNDCDDIDVDYSKRKKSTKVNAPSNGADWEKFQQRILAVPRIHADELWNDDNYVYTFDDDGYMVR